MYDLDETPSEARVQAAAAVRRLVHAMAGHIGDDDQLAAVARSADRLAAALETRDRRIRPPDRMIRYPEPVADGGELSCWPDCMVAGVAHPSSTGAVGHRDGDEAVLTVTLGAGHEGLPGRAHGGIMASLFDEAMGFALWMEVVPAVTAWLKVDYRAPAPIGIPIEVRSSVRERDGRKIVLGGRATAGGAVVAEAEALFVVPRELAEA